ELVDKWFLGMDHPTSGGYSYALASGQLFVNGATNDDVKQGQLSDCGFLASLAEVALRNNSAITNMFIDNGDGTYTVRFYHSGAAQYVTVDSYLPSSGGAFIYDLWGASMSDPSNELWTALAEKAYAQDFELNGGSNNYASVAYLYPYTPLAAITGQSTVGMTSTTGSTALSTLSNAWNTGQSIVLVSLSGAPNVVGNHCYTVVGFDSSTGTVTLFNPWGIGYGLTTLNWSQVRSNFGSFDRTS